MRQVRLAKWLKRCEADENGENDEKARWTVISFVKMFLWRLMVRQLTQLCQAKLVD